MYHARESQNYIASTIVNRAVHENCKKKKIIKNTIKIGSCDIFEQNLLYKNYEETKCIRRLFVFNCVFLEEFMLVCEVIIWFPFEKVCYKAKNLSEIAERR